MRPGEMPLASKPSMMALAMAPAPIKPMFRLCNGEGAVMALMLVQRCWLAVCGYPRASADKFSAAPVLWTMLRSSQLSAGDECGTSSALVLLTRLAYRDALAPNPSKLCGLLYSP